MPLVYLRFGLTTLIFKMCRNGQRRTRSLRSYMHHVEKHLLVRPVSGLGFRTAPWPACLSESMLWNGRLPGEIRALNPKPDERKIPKTQLSALARLSVAFLPRFCLARTTADLLALRSQENRPHQISGREANAKSSRRRFLGTKVESTALGCPQHSAILVS